MVQYHEWIFIPPRILQVMNHKISVRRQNLIQKFKKNKSHHHLIILIFRISLSFFQKLFLTSAKYLCFLFPFFLENFSSTKKFHERKKLIRELKKEKKKKKIKREEEEKTLPKCVLVSFNAVNTIFRNTFVH